VHLLLRLVEPQGGSVTIGGIDLREFRLQALRGQIGLVAQQVMLFNASVRDNIAYGRVDASQDAIEHAAQAARAHDFITQLPQGYDTVIGDQGVKLSGGQKQRIALARALLKDPPILILDEATAMFDPAGELEFIDECREVLANRTVILITHRPASLALADRVVRLEGGRFV
jgi:subfamily B ATP-binding cassette protein MsbA